MAVEFSLLQSADLNWSRLEHDWSKHFVAPVVGPLQGPDNNWSSLKRVCRNWSGAEHVDGTGIAG